MRLVECSLPRRFTATVVLGFCAVGFCAMGFCAVGCGSAPKSTKTPEVEAAAPNTAKPQEKPTAREKRAARPTMSAEAAAAYQAGLAAFERGDLAGAEAQLRQATTIDPRAHQAHFALGTVLDRSGDPTGARRAYREALSLVPDFEPAIAEMAFGYLRAGQLSEASSFLRVHRAQAEDSAAILAAEAELASQQKDTAQAQKLAQRALKLDPDYRPAMVVLARDHYRNRRLDLALYTLTAILDGYGPENPPRDANNAEARMLRALIYKEQSRRNEAIAELRRIVTLRPDMVDARLHLSAYMLEAGNAAEAVPLLEGALAFEPSNPLLHLNLGDAYRLQGRPLEALTQLDWVTKAAPDMPETYYNIGLVYLFSSKVGALSELASAERAILAFETYLAKRGAVRAAGSDDAEELLDRAKNRKAVLEAMNAPPVPQGTE